MLDLNVTLLFQLANFFIAIYVLNILLIRPIREIIKKRNGVMDDMAEEAGSFEYQAGERLTNYEAELARARQDAGSNREAGRAAGVAEQQKLVGEAQQSARDVLALSLHDALPISIFWLKPAPRCRHRLRKPLLRCASRWVNFPPVWPTASSRASKRR